MCLYALPAFSGLSVWGQAAFLNNSHLTSYRTCEECRCIYIILIGTDLFTSSGYLHTHSTHSHFTDTLCCKLHSGVADNHFGRYTSGSERDTDAWGLCVCVYVCGMRLFRVGG